MIKKALKMVSLTIIGIICLLVVIVMLFISFSPELGGKASEEQKAIYAKSDNYQNGTFMNLGDVKMSFTSSEYVDMMLKFLKKQPNSIPDGIVPVEKIDSIAIADYTFENPRIIWFGHSTVLLQINGKNILIDPMFGDVPAPHPWVGSERFNKELPIEIEKLPQIDAVILSHDHYDHLDYGSIMKLKNKVKAFYTPLGVGNHLIEWGVDKNIITELDWWEEVYLDSLRFICTPAQHFSGRGLSDRAATLWASWIVQSDKKNIFFSGDSGYGDHFKEIGEKHGPFDFAMMECGQYNEQWIEIHMMPEQTAQAALDLNAKKFMPIHWGSFKLSLHSWTDPAERVSVKAAALGLNLLTPIIGEPLILNGEDDHSTTEWWTEI